MPGLILYGPPAVGKDTVTTHLVALDQRYTFFRRLKVGAGRTAGYRMATKEQIDVLRAAKNIVYENHRYGSSYYIDRETLREQLTREIPVLHLGQPEGIGAVRGAFSTDQWLVVALTCPRNIAATRIAARGTGDTPDRLAAWDATEPIDADLTVDTSSTSPTMAAHQIHQALATLQRA